MIKIGIFNQKGGVGKTTSAINISGFLAKKYKKKILLVDTDPQANLSKSILQENNFSDDDLTLVDILEKEINVNAVIKTALIKTRANAKPKNLGIDVIPTKREMIATEIKDENVINDLIVNSLEREYDFLIYDCPPFLSNITVSVLASCDYVIVPASVDIDSLGGYSELIDTINALKINGVSKDIEILSIFLTMFKNNENFDKYIYDECKENFGNKFSLQTIRRSTQVKQASFFGTPLSWFKSTSKVAKDYEALTDEIVRKIKEREINA